MEKKRGNKLLGWAESWWKEKIKVKAPQKLRGKQRERERKEQCANELEAEIGEEGMKIADRELVCRSACSMND